MRFLPSGTLKTAAHKLDSLQRRAWLPPTLLLLALSSVFMFGAERRGYFYQGGIHSEISAKNLAIAENLSPEHHFLMFTSRTLDTAGRHTYEVYNRFPIGGFALIKLAGLPFGDDLSAKIYAVRMLMLLFFASAAFMAYLSLRRLASSRWIALTAALLAFSSPPALYFNDAITSEAAVDVFGALLVFHGMAVFEQEGRFPQLLLKTCIALLLGWHVYAMLLPFIVFGLMRELIKTRSGISPPPFTLCQLKHATLSLLRSRYLTLGVAALLFGISALTFNFTNEYFALNREIAPTELPSFKSMMLRTAGLGLEAVYPHAARSNHLHWQLFWKRQFHRVGTTSLPYAFFPSFAARDTKLTSLFVIYGIAALGASLIGLLFVRRHKILLASLTLSGFCWALTARYSVAYPWHSHEAVFYIGVALTLFSLILLFLRKAGGRLVAALSIMALLVLIVSVLRMSQPNNPKQTDILHKAAIADFQLIRSMTDDGNLIQIGTIPHEWEWFRSIDYYLSGRIVISGHEITPSASPLDYVVSSLPLDELASLTPQNQMAFLYEWNDYHRHIDEIIEQTDEPLTHHGFDVHLVGNALIYAKDACREDDVTEKFFLTLYPAYGSDLPDVSRPYGFNNLAFHFEERSIRRGERCIAIAPLPEYDIAHIYTGQYIQRPDGSTAHSWAVWLIDGKMRHIDEIIKQAGEPLIRSKFDVYFDGSILIYLKDACSEDDVSEKFFLALYPTDESDLPVDRRQRGYDNTDFRFQDHGARLGKRCIAIAPRPEYAIDHIHTGQYIDRADGSFEHMWEGNIHLTETAR